MENIVFALPGAAMLAAGVFLIWKGNPASRGSARFSILEFGEMLALCGMLFLVKGIWHGFESHWLPVSVAAWLIVGGFDIWYTCRKPTPVKKKKGQ